MTERIGAGINGIRFLSGASVIIENCEIFGFTAAAINIAPSASSRVFVSKSTLTNNLNGVFVDGTRRRSRGDHQNLGDRN